MNPHIFHRVVRLTMTWKIRVTIRKLNQTQFHKKHKKILRYLYPSAGRQPSSLFSPRPLNPRSGRIIAAVKNVPRESVPRLFIASLISERIAKKGTENYSSGWSRGGGGGGVWWVQTTLKKSEQFFKVFRYLPRNWNKPPKKARSFANNLHLIA